MANFKTADEVRAVERTVRGSKKPRHSDHALLCSSDSRQSRTRHASTLQPTLSDSAPPHARRKDEDTLLPGPVGMVQEQRNKER